MHILFVYGTLMRGERAHHLLADATLLGPARTAPHFTLHTRPRYPALAADGQTGVLGELYRVSPAAMAQLDAYESDDYDRVEIELEEGPCAVAEAYVMPARLVRDLPIIASGDWRDR